MKIIYLISILFFVFCPYAASAPSNFSILTFAISSYQDKWQDNSSQSRETANALVSSLKSNLLEKYPQITFSSTGYYDELVTKQNFLNSSTNNFNFVFYKGHGGPNYITMWPKYESVYNTSKKFGGKTYWVLLRSCLVFKNGETNQDPWFNGVHSILGYSSLSWNYEKYKHYYRCGFLNIGQCSYSRASYYVERDFATNWIKQKQGIWAAYSNAVYKWIAKEQGLGVEPKIVYRYGYVDGKFFDPWEETFENSIQKPVFKNAGEYSGIGSRWNTMGTPCYSTPCK